MMSARDFLAEKGRGGPLFFMSAGDPSGDIYGSRLIEQLRHEYPGAVFIGIGGNRMAASGAHLLADPKRIATVGFTEIVRDVPFFYGLLSESEDVFQTLCPELVVLIDYPGFNLRLAERAKRRGLKTLFYVSPQVWAWGRRRYKRLVRDSDEIAVIFPFEVEIFREWGKAVHYVGHPMIGEIAAREPRESFMARYGLSPDKPILGISPGSRRREIAYHLPVFVKVAEKVRRVLPDVQVLVNRAPVLSEREMRQRYMHGADEIRIVNDSHHTSIDVSNLLLTKSGTSTLEAALLGTPMLVCYRMSHLSYYIAKTLVSLPHISLVNILAGREVVPEYIQRAFDPDLIFPAAMELLENRARRKQMIRDLQEVAGQLQGGNASERVARLVISMIEDGREA